MKKFKKLLIITFCFALLLTTTTVPNNYDINPCGHLSNKGGEF